MGIAFESLRNQFLDYIAKTKRMSIHTVSAYTGDLKQFEDFWRLSMWVRWLIARRFTFGVLCRCC